MDVQPALQPVDLAVDEACDDWVVVLLVEEQKRLVLDAGLRHRGACRENAEEEAYHRGEHDYQDEEGVGVRAGGCGYGGQCVVHCGFQPFPRQ